MDISTSTPVVTGAGRGLGRHLVDGVLDQGVVKVYALARDTSTVSQDPRVVPVHFDLRDPASIEAAARVATDATLVINNASTAVFSTPLEADLAAVRTEIEVNFDGLYRTLRAFVPVIEANGGGHIVNVLSLRVIDLGAVLGPDDFAGFQAGDVDQPALGDDLGHGLDPEMLDAAGVGEFLDGEAAVPTVPHL